MPTRYRGGEARVIIIPTTITIFSHSSLVYEGKSKASTSETYNNEQNKRKVSCFI